MLRGSEFQILRHTIFGVYAGPGQQAFHVIAPSIPGFAFSSAPKQKGFGLKQIAKTFNQLMLELGYTKYVAQGTLKPLYPEPCGFTTKSGRKRCFK